MSLIFILVFSQTSLPIGTILPYVGDLANIPSGWHLCDGSNGTPDLSDRFLEGTTNTPKAFKDAGLPNITGSTSGTDVQGGFQGTGAFYVSSWGNYNDHGGTYHSNYGYSMSFDASRVNPIYGSSDTVQPKSYTVYYIMHVK